MFSAKTKKQKNQKPKTKFPNLVLKQLFKIWFLVFGFLFFVENIGFWFVVFICFP
jgi:hypothetical protein